MAEQRKQQKVKNRIFWLVVLLFGYSCSFAQKPSLSLVAKESRDSISVFIKNNLRSDTVLFSLYSQSRINNKWITSNYDLFCDVTNPNTSVFIIYPNQEITLTAARPTKIYTSKNVKTGTSKCRDCRRIVLVGNKKNNEAIEYKAYSNTL